MVEHQRVNQRTIHKLKSQCVEYAHMHTHTHTPATLDPEKAFPLLLGLVLRVYSEEGTPGSASKLNMESFIKIIAQNFSDSNNIIHNQEQKF